MASPWSTSFRARPSLDWALKPAGLCVWYPWLLYSWWQVAEEKLRDTVPSGTPAAAIVAMAGLGLAANLAGHLGEALFYRIWWRRRGRVLPFWRFFSWVAVYSAADLFALSLAARADRSPDLAPWVAVLAGIGVLPGSPLRDQPALRAGFGGLGLLTLARIAITAHAQAAGAGVRFGKPIALTAGAWLAARVATWWSVDLLRGASPLS